MKRKALTLQQVIDLFPDRDTFTINNNIPENFSELDYRQRYKYLGCLSEKYFCTKKNNTVFLGVHYSRVVRHGKNIHRTSEITASCIITKNSIKTKNLFSEFVLYIFRLANVSNLKFLEEEYRSLNLPAKLYIIKLVLTGKIYNEESFYKEWFYAQYHIRNVNWRLLKRYDKCASVRYSILDLLHFTKNLEQSLVTIALLQETRNTDKLNLLSDMLSLAVQLGEVIDFTWSDKRLRNEHARQIREVKQGELTTKDVTPIYDLQISEPNITLLNTEKDVYLEGNVMSHCLYRCYWNKIKNKHYIAFHMTSPEECTFSVKANDLSITLDQIYLSHDRPVQNQTRELAIQFIKKYYKQLGECLIPEHPFISPLPENFIIETPF